tara:strand:- start:4227 stop:4439 length:213 start_codon:yes stop_codon:yes gene_type:complete
MDAALPFQLRFAPNAGIGAAMITYSILDGMRFTGRTHGRTSLEFLPVGDHKRLPARFFAALTGADRSFLG